MGKTRHMVLNELGQTYGFEVDYDPEQLEDTLMKPMFLLDTPIEEVIDRLLKDTDFHYALGEGKLILRPTSEEIQLIFTPQLTDFTLKGLLMDQNSGEALPFATIRVKGTEHGATSNVDGYFTLLHVPTDTSTLVVSYIGYRRREFKLTPNHVASGQRVEIGMESAVTELESVTISDRKEHMVKLNDKISAVSISPAQLSALPSLGEKDIFRSLQLLPGVSGTNETSSGLYVRGGTPDQNLILFDGFTVYHVDHFYGFFSAFNANAVKDIQLFKGGFEAKYGGRLSSVVDLTGKTGNSNEVSGNVGVSAISVNGSLEVPFDEGRGNIFLAGRRSYTDVIQSGLYNDIFDLYNDSNNNTTPQNAPGGGRGGFRGGGGRFGQIENEPSFYFYDLNTKISYRPTDQDVVSFSLYNGKDNLDNSNEVNSAQLGFDTGNGPNFNNATTDINSWGNWGSSFRWGRQWNDRLYSNTIVSYSKYFTDRDRFSTTEITREDSTFAIRNGTIEDNNVNDFTAKTDLEWLATSKHTVGLGIQYTYNDVSYLQTRNDTLTVLDRQDQGATTSAYLQDSWSPTDRLTVNAGLRLVNFSKADRAVYFEPRLSASYNLTNGLKLKAAWGQYNQFVTRVVREDVSQGSRDFWLLANEDLNPPSSATHYIAGLSYETEQFLFDVELYRKNMDGLSEYTLRFANNFRQSSIDELFFQGTGYAQGVEFLVQKKFGKYTGWLAYTLSEVIHDFPGISDEPYPALHDQTHEFKTVNSLRLGRWTLAGTWVFATGNPYTAPIGGYELTLLDGASTSYISVGEKNGFRLPNYHRLDVSANYTLKLGKKATADAGISVFNLYDRSNIWYKTFEVIENDVVTTDVTTIGFTPNIFFNLKF